METPVITKLLVQVLPSHPCGWYELNAWRVVSVPEVVQDASDLRDGSAPLTRLGFKDVDDREL